MIFLLFGQKNHAFLGFGCMDKEIQTNIFILLISHSALWEPKVYKWVDRSKCWILLFFLGWLGGWSHGNILLANFLQSRVLEDDNVTKISKYWLKEKFWQIFSTQLGPNNIQHTVEINQNNEWMAEDENVHGFIWRKPLRTFVKQLWIGKIFAN
jgi:hypothetical protein